MQEVQEMQVLFLLYYYICLFSSFFNTFCVLQVQDFHLVAVIVTESNEKNMNKANLWAAIALTLMATTAVVGCSSDSETDD